VPDLVKTAVRLGLPVFGCAWIAGHCRGIPAATWTCWTTPCTASVPWCAIAESASSKDCPRNSGRPLPLLIRARATLPACLEVTAKPSMAASSWESAQGTAIEAVQFHPESILTLTPGRTTDCSSSRRGAAGEDGGDGRALSAVPAGAVISLFGFGTLFFGKKGSNEVLEAELGAGSR